MGAVRRAPGSMSRNFLHHFVACLDQEPSTRCNILVHQEEFRLQSQDLGPGALLRTSWSLFCVLKRIFCCGPMATTKQAEVHLLTTLVCASRRIKRCGPIDLRQLA